MSWTTITDISPIAWYKADAITGLSDGDPIDTWPDSSGNGRDLTQTGTARPLYKTGIVNSLPVARFDGSNDELLSAAFTVSTRIDAVVVFKIATTTPITNSVLAINNSATPTNPAKYLIGRFDQNLDLQLLHFPTGVSTNYAYRFYKTDVSLNTFAIAAFSQPDGTTSSHQFAQINGKTTQSDAFLNNLAPATSGNAIINVGYSYISGRYLDGDIAEIIVFSQTSDSEHTWLEGYLSHKYGITLQTGHLFKNAAPTSAPPTYNAAGGGVRIPNIRGGADQ